MIWRIATLHPSLPDQELYVEVEVPAELLKEETKFERLIRSPACLALMEARRQC